MDARAEKCKRDYEQLQSNIHRIEVNVVVPSSKTVSELKQNLRRALNEFASATRMSNVGSTECVTAMTDVLRCLDSVEDFLGNLKL